MPRVRVLVGEDDEDLGEFDFAQLPRKDDEITVPWAADPQGVRIFQVIEVIHVAAGVTGTPYGDGPLTLLRYCFEIP